MPASAPSAPVPGRLTQWQRFLEESSFLRHYLWKYRKLVAIGMLALLTVDLLEVLPPLLLRRVVDHAVVQKDLDELIRLASAYFGISVIQGICRYGWRMYLIRSSMLSGRDIRDQFASKLLALSAHFYDKRRIGDLMSLATTDVEAIRMALGAGFLILGDALFYFVSTPVAMWCLSPKLTLIALAPMVIVPWFVMRNEREIHQRFEKVQESFGRLSAMVQENLNGIRVVKAFAREDRQIDRLHQAGVEHVKLSLSLARVSTTFGPTLDFFMSTAMVVLLYFGGHWVMAGALTLGTFVAFQRYIQKMIWPMSAFAMAVNHYQRAVASTQRIKEVEGEKTNVPEAPSPVLPEGYFAVPAGAWKTAGRVEMRSLNFRYPGASSDTIRDFSLVIEPGERIALVGSIGSGKSAILSLLPRLYPVSRGMCFVDGVDVNDWPIAELRNQIGYVSQDVFLFSDTVTENVALGIHGWQETEELLPTIEVPARQASVHEELLGLERGYSTRLGERGVNLSGGQKQRLSIARALAKRPSILVLDDALSSVDVQTEERILRGLRAREGRNTEIISAHRISTIKDADRIIYLEGGMIRQQGTHEELIQDRRTGYGRFYEQQRLKEDFENYVETLQ